MDQVKDFTWNNLLLKMSEIDQNLDFYRITPWPVFWWFFSALENDNILRFQNVW